MLEVMTASNILKPDPLAITETKISKAKEDQLKVTTGF